MEEYEIQHKKARMDQNIEMQEEIEILRAEELEFDPPKEGVRERSSLMPQGT